MNPIMQFIPIGVFVLVVFFVFILFKALEKDPKRDESLARGPKVKYRLKATLFCLAGFFCAVLARTVERDAGVHITWPVAILLAPYVQLISFPLWFYGCYALVNGKGYKWFWALLGFFPLIGLIVLIGFKNKRDPMSPRQSKASYILWVCAILFVLYLAVTAWQFFIHSVAAKQRASLKEGNSSSPSQSLTNNNPSRDPSTSDANNKDNENELRLAEHFIKRGEDYVLAHRYQEAIQPLETAIRLNPEDARAYSSLGFSYLSLQRFDEAIKPFEHAIRLRPEGTPAYYGLGIAYSNLDRYQEAVEPLKHAVRINPEKGIIYHYLGWAYFKLNDKSSALEVCETLKGIDPKEAEKLLNQINGKNGKSKEDAPKAETPDGPYKTYYESGQLKKEGVRKNGLLEGQSKEYYASGKLESEMFFKDGKPEGPAKFYYENGQLKVEGFFKDGKSEGFFKYYYASGQLEKEGAFKSGLPEGLTKFYYENGQLEKEAVQKSGKTEGLCKWYYPNGQLKKEGVARNGVLEGQFKEYEESGKLKKNGEISERFEQVASFEKLGSSTDFKTLASREPSASQVEENVTRVSKTDPDIFVEATAEKTEIHQDERTVFKFDLYTRYNTRFLGVVTPPSFQGFEKYAEVSMAAFPVGSGKEESVTRDGKEYKKNNIFRSILKPLGPGVCVVTPPSIKVSVQIGVDSDDKRSWEERTLQTLPLKITVLSELSGNNGIDSESSRSTMEPVSEETMAKAWDAVADMGETRKKRIAELTEKAVLLLPSNEVAELTPLLRRFTDGGYASLSEKENAVMQDLERKAISLLPSKDQDELMALIKEMASKFNP